MAHIPSLLACLASFETEADVAADIPAVTSCLETAYANFGWHRALAELELTLELVGDKRRRDGTPSILHELSQQVYTLGLIDAGLLQADDPNVQRIVILNASHDRCEDVFMPADKHLSPDELRRTYVQWHAETVAARLGRVFPEPEDIFTALLTWNMSKTCGEIPLYPTPETGYRRMLRHPATAIAKLPDRVHNNATLIGGLRQQGLLDNLAETRQLYGQYTNKAAENFPRYKPVFTFYHRLIAKQIRTTEHLLGILDDPGQPRLKGMFDNAANGFTLPHGFNPVLMIVRRAARERPAGFMPQPWHSALEPGAELH